MLNCTHMTHIDKIPLLFASRKMLVAPSCLMKDESGWMECFLQTFTFCFEQVVVEVLIVGRVEVHEEQVIKERKVAVVNVKDSIPHLCFCFFFFWFSVSFQSSV